MLHEGGPLDLSDNIEALQFLIPRAFCDELVVKGDDFHLGVDHSS